MLRKEQFERIYEAFCVNKGMQYAVQVKVGRHLVDLFELWMAANVFASNPMSPATMAQWDTLAATTGAGVGGSLLQLVWEERLQGFQTYLNEVQSLLDYTHAQANAQALAPFVRFGPGNDGTFGNIGALLQGRPFPTLHVAGAPATSQSAVPFHATFKGPQVGTPTSGAAQQSGPQLANQTLQPVDGGPIDLTVDDDADKNNDLLRNGAKGPLHAGAVPAERRSHGLNAEGSAADKGQTSKRQNMKKIYRGMAVSNPGEAPRAPARGVSTKSTATRGPAAVGRLSATVLADPRLEQREAVGSANVLTQIQRKRQRGSDHAEADKRQRTEQLGRQTDHFGSSSSHGAVRSLALESDAVGASNNTSMPSEQQTKQTFQPRKWSMGERLKFRDRVSKIVATPGLNPKDRYAQLLKDMMEAGFTEQQVAGELARSPDLSKSLLSDGLSADRASIAPIRKQASLAALTGNASPSHPRPTEFATSEKVPEADFVRYDAAPQPTVSAPAATKQVPAESASRPQYIYQYVFDSSNGVVHYDINAVSNNNNGEVSPETHGKRSASEVAVADQRDGATQKDVVPGQRRIRKLYDLNSPVQGGGAPKLQLEPRHRVGTVDNRSHKKSASAQPVATNSLGIKSKQKIMVQPEKPVAKGSVPGVPRPVSRPKTAGDVANDMMRWIRATAREPSRLSSLNAEATPESRPYGTLFARLKEAMKHKEKGHSPGEGHMGPPTSSPSAHLSHEATARRSHRLKETVTLDRSLLAFQKSTKGSIGPRLYCGPQYQAQLPIPSSRPQQPSEYEERFLLPRAVFKGAGVDRATDRAASTSSDPSKFANPPDGPTAIMDTLKGVAQVRERHQVLDTLLDNIDSCMKPGQRQALGISNMGSRALHSWTPLQQKAFAAGIEEYGRDFKLFRDKFLPGKSHADVVRFYYNVWKPKRTSEAEEWYTRAAMSEHIQFGVHTVPHYVDDHTTQLRSLGGGEPSAPRPFAAQPDLDTGRPSLLHSPSNKYHGHA